MYIIDDAWNIIKSFIIHDIKKQGKHLKTQNKDVCNYNEVIKSIPIIKCPHTGPRIIYCSKKRVPWGAVKFLYHGNQLKSNPGSYPKYNTIIEYMQLDTFRPNYYTIFGMDLTTKKNVAHYYQQNIKNAISKLI